MSLEDCRSKLSGVELWRALQLPDWEKVSRVKGGKEAKIKSPFRPDKNPSFSVFLKGDILAAKDHGSGEGFDDVGLIAAVRGCSVKDAIKVYHELAGVRWGNSDGPAPRATKPAAPKRELAEPKIQQSAQGERVVKPKMGRPSDAEVAAQGGRKLVAEYEYKDVDGTVLHKTLRYWPKDFRQCRRPLPDEVADAGGWVWKGVSDGRLVPYRLPEMTEQKGSLVLVVEGEKDADNLAGLLGDKSGVVVTSLPMGTGKWRDEFASYFRGRHVVILADFDQPKEDGSAAGYDGAVKVAGELQDIAGRVGLLEITDFWASAPYGSDVSDWLERGRDSGRTDDELQDDLVQAVRAARLPMGMVYSGCVYVRGASLGIFEDLLAQRMVHDEQLIFSAQSFWRYDGAGVWEKEKDTLAIQAKIREALGVLNAGELITAARVSSILNLSKSVSHCPPEAMNRQPDGWVCVENGILDTKTGELHPHNPHYFITNRCPHRWNPEAKCPKWLDWLRERHDNDEETVRCIQEIFGYCLGIDINYHVFFFFYGDGGTGKSTCVGILEELVGDANRVSLQLEELNNGFTRSQLVGKSVYLCKELTTNSFQHIGLIKAIVSGDKIPVDIKYGQPFDFRPYGRMVMESNVLAHTPDSSAGFSRRFVQVDWGKVVKTSDMDFSLGDKLLAEIEGILVWAMQGLLALRQRGHFKLTEKSEKAKKLLMNHRAQIQSWMDSGILTEAEDLKIDTRRMHDSYLEWCEDADVVPFYKEVPPFMREVMSKRPDWRARKKRVRTDMGREHVITGLGLCGKYQKMMEE